MSDSRFDQWLRTHPQNFETLWAIQNCLGTVLGFDHPEAVAATNAWRNAMRNPSSSAA